MRHSNILITVHLPQSLRLRYKKYKTRKRNQRLSLTEPRRNPATNKVKYTDARSLPHTQQDQRLRRLRQAQPVYARKNLEQPGDGQFQTSRSGFCTKPPFRQSVERTLQFQEVDFMTTWVNFILNPERVYAIFQEAPRLEKVRVRCMEFDQDGPCLEVGITLNDYPATPPTKWSKRGFNTATIGLRFIGLHTISLTKWDTNNIVDIVLSKENVLFDSKKIDAIRFSFESDNHVVMSGLSSFVDVSGIGAH